MLPFIFYSTQTRYLIFYIFAVNKHKTFCYSTPVWFRHQKKLNKCSQSQCGVGWIHLMAIPKIPELLEFSQFNSSSIADRYSAIAMPYLTMLKAVDLSETYFSSKRFGKQREIQKAFYMLRTGCQICRYAFFLVASELNSPFLGAMQPCHSSCVYTERQKT